MTGSLNRRLQVIESDYGRNHGWFLEQDGICLAELSEPRWAEMFWTTYRIEPTPPDPQVRQLLRSEDFWHSCDFTFRNRYFREAVVDHAFGGRGPAEDEVTIRGLYLSVREPSWWEALRCRRRLQQIKGYRGR